MSEVVRDNTSNPVTEYIGNLGVATVSFTFTATNQLGLALSEIDLSLYNSISNDFGNVAVTVGKTGSYDPNFYDQVIVHDGMLSTTPGSLYTIVPDRLLLLDPGQQYVISVRFSFYSSAQLGFSASTAGIDIASESYTDSNGSFSYGRGPQSPTGSYIGRVLAAPAADVAATIVCYAAGTLILTSRGEVPIEALQPGDLLFSPRTLSFVPALWIAHQRVRDPAHQAVRVAAGALGPGKPHTDLITSPNHSLFLDGILVPASALVNGATITWEPRPSIDYHHIECAAHDLVLANGTPSETWLDYGNRYAFDNVDAHHNVLPIRSPLAEAALADLPDHCVPCIQHGPAVIAIRRTVRTRAVELGYTLSGDADLHMVADGARVEPHWVEPSIAAFHVPATTRTLHLVSRAVRAHDLVDTADTRVLGVAVGRIWISGQEVGLDTLEGQPGWSGKEIGDAPFRWTDGAASLPSGAGTIRIEVLRQLQYLAAPVPQDTEAHSAV